MSDGIKLYTEEGDPVRVTLLDDYDDQLKHVEVLDQGIHGYESENTTITMILEGVADD